ncbi:MAG: DNA polymerase IV, partial [Anaerolineales bacterium]|nr:DNA polymerase IV [Anaerolineales bacterium]
MRRKILHVDLDAFFCSVEALLDPALASRPFAVGGRPDERGVISSASYAARAWGVRSAMPTAQALRLCPELVLVRARHHVYGDYSERVMAILREAAPVVEQLSIDEAFLDVSDDARSGTAIAATLKAEIRESHGLPTSWGIASNKLVAKIATEVGKPDGLVAVPQGEEAAFLAPLPVQMLWGVGPKTTQILVAEGIAAIGDLAGWPPDRLTALFGERGPELASSALGVDSRRVVAEHQPKSLSAERTFARDIRARQALEAVLVELVGEVGQRLREQELVGATVRLKLRWSDFTTILRQASLPQPTSLDQEILAAARSLLRA